MNSSCENNQNMALAAQMAQANYFASLAAWSPVSAWPNVTFNLDLFILKQRRNVRTMWHGCRKRFLLNT